MAALEQTVEMRDVAKARAKGDFGYGSVSGLGINQHARAGRNPPVIDVFADRAIRHGKQTMDVALGATKLRGKRRRAKFGILAVTLDMIDHHRQQNGDVHALGGQIAQHVGRVCDQIDHMRTDQGRGPQTLMIGEADFGIAAKSFGESPARLRARQVELRTIEQLLRQQPSRDGEAEELEIVTVGDLERLRRIGDGEIAGRTGLLVVALAGAPEPFDLEVDETKIVGAPGNM
ncbi:hypothetical protein QA640_35195 [Bradyrhizobium sp. CB82]|uniref:hypothetical protein n=1 Tax=Bradyrhizobium sp. CB82 TaxID=3039159 RepID=UPI0024B1C199|nr:hypothetical protein [Bradyrhizobium sp. CB82]WFU39560.1 hypothetical protein QA640_35195 [Bradyrhizobium sp. CB82]